MEIRLAKLEDVEAIENIYTKAKSYMRLQGNMTQWINGYPSQQDIINDINRLELYVVCQNHIIHGVFMFSLSQDPYYEIIEQGHWLNDAPYGVIHRIASDGTIKRMFKTCFEYCKQFSNNIKIDTHQDNLTMQNAVLREGFKYCGIVYVANHSPRLAYQWTKN